MDIVSELLILAVLILVNAFFAAAEIALVSASDVRLKTLAERGDHRAEVVLRLTSDTTRLLATLQVGVTLAGFFTSATAATGIARPLAVMLSPSLGEGTATALSIGLVTTIIAFISLVLGELVPKRLALHNAEQVCLIVSYPISFLNTVAAPVIRLISGSAGLVLRWMGATSLVAAQESASIEEIKAIVDAARTGGTVGEQERRIIYGAVELSHISARAIMVPRVQIQYLKADIPIEEAYQVVSENAHTRLPVCEDDLDRIIGILHVKDLIRPMAAMVHHPPTLRELVRPVKFVSEHKLATELLRDMQKNRLHMVIVQDEFGGTAGLLTLEDVLEEIVGEIRDEYDAEEEKEFKRVNEDEAIFKIRASLATVNNELNVQLPRDDVATLAGLFLEELQRPPVAGDRLEIDHITLEVMEDGQRVVVRRITELA
ncbi:MAG: HlyC/CorC family transporter [Oscillatoriales cyanobacterium SM2_2_1]|nr:HlyC/CorC family transporter [Oscillatoriales cyanobacterium SM2_2_1]